MVKLLSITAAVLLVFSLVSVAREFYLFPPGGPVQDRDLMLIRRPAVPGFDNQTGTRNVTVADLKAVFATNSGLVRKYGTYSAMLHAHRSETTTAHGGIVADSDPRLSDARTPLSHTQAMSTIDGLESALDGKASTAAFANQSAALHAHRLETLQAHGGMGQMLASHEQLTSAAHGGLTLYSAYSSHLAHFNRYSASRQADRLAMQAEINERARLRQQASFANVSAADAYARSLIAPTVTGTVAGGGLNMHSNPSNNGTINFGSSYWDEGKEIWYLVKSLATTAVNVVAKVANYLHKVGGSVFISFTSKDQNDTEYEAARMGTVFGNRSAGKQTATFALDLISSLRTRGFKRKLTVDSNGLTTINGALVIGGDASGITMTNRSTILSGYVRHNSYAALYGVSRTQGHDSTWLPLSLGHQNATTATGEGSISNWYFAIQAASGNLTGTTLGSVGGMIIGPMFFASGGAGTVAMRISPKYISTSTGPNYLADIGYIRNDGGTQGTDVHVSLVTVDHKGRSVFRGYTNTAYTGTVEIDSRGVTMTGASRLNWRKKTAAYLNLSAGTLTGTLAGIQTARDGQSVAIAEAAATPGQDIRATFDLASATERFNWVSVLSCYDGASTHALLIQLYNWTTNSWDTFGAVQSGYCGTANPYYYGNQSFIVPDTTNYIRANTTPGRVRVRLYHGMAGNVSHDTHIDEIALYQ